MSGEPLSAEEHVFARVSMSLRDASRSLNDAIQVSSNSHDALMESWVGEQASKHRERWSGLVNEAQQLIADLESNSARLTDVIESIVDTDAYSSSQTSLLDLS